jgi:peptidoglycan/LPS O-acetylase OafA/YrhL
MESQFNGANIVTKSWLTELEGLRGLAALWVFAVHVSILCGTNIPVISWGALGVDLFILLSGFLMVHQYEQRKDSNPWTSRKTIGHFWCRRFFRIAPLYYILLTVAFAIDPILEWARLDIGTHYPSSLTNSLRYSDRTLANILTHFSFSFGFLPHYSFETALPDWSIGLEMQFYLLFPLLMIVVLRLGYIWMTIVTLAASVAAYFAFPAFFQSFPMGSFLPLRINLFLLGMLIAAAYHAKVRHAYIYVPLLPLIALVVTSNRTALGVVADVVLAGLLLVVTYPDARIRQVTAPIRWILNSTIAQRLGDISYSVYLVHLLVIMPLCAWLLHFRLLTALPQIPRFALFFAASGLIVFPLAMLLYYAVEQPGIRLGKRILDRKPKPVMKPA